MRRTFIVVLLAALAIVATVAARQTTSLAPSLVVTTDASDNLSIVNGGACSGTGQSKIFANTFLSTDASGNLKVCGAAGGTVSGPGSSTNTAIAKWNGTTGTTLADSGVLIDASNNITIPSASILNFSTDVGIKRNGAASLKVTDGSSGLGDVVANAVRARGAQVTFENSGGSNLGYIDVTTADKWKFMNSSNTNNFMLSSATPTSIGNVGANSCGTTAATLSTNSTNTAGEFVVGATSGTQCRLTFSVAATNAWQCTANDETTTIALRVTSVSTTTTDFLGAFTAGDKVSYICVAR